MQGFLAKIRTVKISSGASSGAFAKVCTPKSSPLYGISLLVCQMVFVFVDRHLTQQELEWVLSALHTIDAWLHVYAYGHFPAVSSVFRAVERLWRMTQGCKIFAISSSSISIVDMSSCLFPFWGHKVHCTLEHNNNTTRGYFGCLFPVYLTTTS